MPIVTISWFEGRNIDQRRRISEDITTSMVQNADAKPEEVTILFIDIPRTHVAKAGKLRI